MAKIARLISTNDCDKTTLAKDCAAKIEAATWEITPVFGAYEITPSGSR